MDPSRRRVPRSQESGTARSKAPLGMFYWMTCLLALFLAFFTAVGFQTSCTESTTNQVGQAEWNASLFQEKRARYYLRELTKRGPKVVGSTENEVYTPEYIIKTLNVFSSQQQQSNGHLSTELSDQTAKLGSFSYKSMTSVYQNIRNIAFRIRHINSSSSAAILINCHYDSVIVSPGASDDGASCATMLEVIRVVLTRQTPLLHELIFLFNGAEENILQASHAFVTQHPWMAEVRLVVNLEAAGSGGRQLVFQAGPENPWIINEYARAASVPYASSLGQDVFQSGQIPSDTDYRIFRDYGHVPGIDIAYISNGYVYHTEFDTEARIPPTCLQNAGENLLEFTLRLAHSPYVTRPGDFLGGDSVYFDFLGLFFVRYTARVGFWINMLTCLVVLSLTALKVWRDRAHAKRVLLALLSHVVCLIGLMLAVGAVGLLMHCFGHRMSWYAVRYNIIGLYIFPLVWYVFFHHNYLVRRTSYWPSDEAAQEVHFEAAQLMLTLCLLVLTFCQVNSAYVLLLWILFPAVGRMVWRGIVNKYQSLSTNWPEIVALAGKITSLGIPYLYWMYMVFTLFDVFIPIMGRSGSVIIPDLFMAVLVVFSGLPMVLYFAGDLYLTRASSRDSLRFFFLHSTICYLLVVNFSPYGFPYNQTDVMPRKQRLVVVHVNRVFRNIDAASEAFDSGIWLIPLDSNPGRYLGDHLPELNPAEPTPCSSSEPYCGFPFLYPLAHLFTSFYYLPRKQHLLVPPVELKVIDRVGLTGTSFNLTFSVSGPSHTHIYIKTPANVRLVDWSFREPARPIQRRPPAVDDPGSVQYFVYYSYGKQPAKPLTLWIQFEVRREEDVDDAVVSMALAGHYTHGPGIRTAELVAFTKRLPDWITAIPWSATYERWLVRLKDGARFVQ